MSLVIKKLDETKLLIILIIIFLIILGIYLICSLLKEETDDLEVNNHTVYDLIDSTNKFELYEIYDDNYSVTINNEIINYYNYNLTINGRDIEDRIFLNKHIAFYGDNILFITTDIDTYVSSILLYNRVEKNITIIDKIDGMNIIYEDYIEIFEAGIKLQISNYSYDILRINNKIYDLCKYKKNEVIYKELIYFYDYPSNSFNTIDVIDTKTVNQLKKMYC